MEQGVDRQHIQALLGHRDPKSTEIYLHVSNKSLMGIRSPFDRKEGAGYEQTNRTGYFSSLLSGIS